MTFPPCLKTTLLTFFVLSLSLTILSTNNLPFAFARVVAHVFHIKQEFFLREAKKQIVTSISLLSLCSASCQTKNYCSEPKWIGLIVS